MAEKKEITALDIDFPANIPIESKGVAYFRLTKEFKEFLSLCNEKHGIIGFEFEDGSFNFGVILGKNVFTRYHGKCDCDCHSRICEKQDDFGDCNCEWRYCECGCKCCKGKGDPESFCEK